MENQLSYWYTGQIVTAAQMNDFSRDIYLRFAQLTAQQAPCILSLDLAALTESAGNVSVPAGSFRFVDQAYYAPYPNVIFGNAPAVVLPVTGNGYIVARYTVTPITSLETNYYFPTQYLFVTTVNPVTDVIVCTITAGLISSTGKFFNYFPDITDTGGLVSITGAGGLVVDGAIAANSVLDVGGIATFVANVFMEQTLSVDANGVFLNNSLGPFVAIDRDTNTLSSSYQLRIISEGASSVIPGATHVTAIQAGGGTGAPTLLADYNSGNDRWYSNANPGNADPVLHERALAMLGDINGALPVTQQFSVIDSGGASWVLSCTSLNGSFPTNHGVIICGSSVDAALSTAIKYIDLNAAGIVSIGCSAPIEGVVSLPELTAYASNLTYLDIYTTIGTSLINIQSVTTSGTTTAAVRFNLTFR